MNKTRTAVVLLVLAQGVSGCDSSRSNSPLGPSVVPQPVSQPIPSPSGGRRITGLVKDTAFRPLAGALVEVIEGPNTGTSTSTDREGQFSLTGVFDNTSRFRASREDHVASTATLINAFGSILFHLAVLAPSVNIAGDYTLTFVADSACTGLPAALRTRTYAATIMPSSADFAGWAAVAPNTVFNLALSAASVQDDGIAAIGTAGDFVAFALFNDGLPYIVEEVASKVFVAITGYADMSLGTAGVSTISTTFAGWIAHLDYNPLADGPMSGTTVVNCESRSHRLILTRR